MKRYWCVFYTTENKHKAIDKSKYYVYNATIAVKKQKIKQNYKGSSYEWFKRTTHSYSYKRSGHKANRRSYGVKQSRGRSLVKTCLFQAGFSYINLKIHWYNRCETVILWFVMAA